ncbi:MAG TPA: hypothetical protein VJN95_00140 [Gemmatimonadales bacterium]|nr:hypothetical protein [Gemmatimonadales bacterium]
MADGALSSLVVAILIVVLAWRPPPDRLGAWVERQLESRLAPLLAGTISALALCWSWRGLAPVEVIHDETAYLLQAAMLARGHLVGAPRPLAGFFEQFQVIAEPVLAVKYPPGFALSLVPGIWLGVAGLMPALLVGAAGGLIFALARRLASPPAGLLTWALWLVAPGSIPFRQLVMSETLTAALWLGGWWCLLQWWHSGKTGWLVAAAAAAAWALITRPLTGLAYSLPIVGLVFWRLHTTGRWRALLPAAATAAPIFLVLALQNHAVTGSWTQTAWSEYTRVYAPSDHFGFGEDTTPPLRPLPPDFQDYVWYYGEFHKGFSPAATPRLLAERAAQIGHDVWGSAAPTAVVLAGLGLAGACGPTLFAVVTATLLILLHLGFAHPPEWSIYYEESWPVLLFLTVLGALRCLDLLHARMRGKPTPTGRGLERGPAILAMASVVLCLAPRHLGSARANHDLLAASHLSFRQRIASLPGRTIVFVRYAPNHIFHRSQISNPEDLASAQTWVVYDRGEDNAQLLALAPERAAYLYFERGDSLRPLQSGSQRTR